MNCINVVIETPKGSAQKYDPIWTPLFPGPFPPKEVASFGSDTPMGRADQPVEVGPAYVFLASDAASYITGQVVHVNGGEIING